MGCLAMILLIAAVYAASWGVTIGIVYLICMCFGLQWSMLMATGVWLVLILVQGVFKGVIDKE